MGDDTSCVHGEPSHRACLRCFELLTAERDKFKADLARAIDERDHSYADEEKGNELALALSRSNTKILDERDALRAKLETARAALTVIRDRRLYASGICADCHRPDHVGNTACGIAAEALEKLDKPSPKRAT